MALASTMVWEVRTTGNAANSGGFNSAAAGTDRSQQDAPHVDIDGAAITATVQATTTDLAITGYAVSAADVGNTVRIAGGTMTAGTYEITAIPAAGQWRLDRSGGTAGQTGTGRMGGAQSDPALVAAVSVGFNTIWVQTGTYSFTSATQNVAGGCINTTNGAQNWFGYGAARGDFINPPTFEASGIATATLFAGSQNDTRLININLNGNGLTAIRGADMTGRSTVMFCLASFCTNSGFRTASTGSSIIACGAIGCSTAGNAFLDAGGGVAGSFHGCWAFGNSVTGFNINGYLASSCLSVVNSGATTDGFLVPSNTLMVNCTAYGNGRDGFRHTSTNGVRLINCIAESNGGAGFNNTGSGINLIMLGCATFNNAGGSIAGQQPLINLGFVTGTATFFVDPFASNNYALNTTVGGGAAIRGNGYPTSFILGSSPNNPDRGAVQSSGAGGGGGGSGAGGPVLGQVWGGGA